MDRDGRGPERRGDAVDVDAVLERVARRYAGGGRFTRHYVAGKLRGDPVHDAVLRRAGPDGFGDVLDVGCGRGQVGVALLEAGLARSVLGLDWNPAPLDAARRAAAGLAFRAEVRDVARPAALPRADTVLVVDVLYQLAPAAQDALLREAARAARARVLIRTLDPDRGWRSALGLGLERLGRRVWPNSGAHVTPRPVPALLDVLAEEGFEATAEPCWRGTPFANVLVVGRRR